MANVNKTVLASLINRDVRAGKHIKRQQPTIKNKLDNVNTVSRSLMDTYK